MSLVLYRTTDKIEIEIDGISFFFSPLSLQTKKMLLSDAGRLEKDPAKMLEFSIQVLKKSLKAIKGITLVDGSDYSFELVNNELPDHVIDDLLNLENFEKMLTVSFSLMSKIPSDTVVNPQTGLPLEGVRVMKKK